MPTSIQAARAREKRRICRALKKLGVSKKSLSEQIGIPYQTVKTGLNADHPGWSRVIPAANAFIVQKQAQPVTAGE